MRALIATLLMLPLAAFAASPGRAATADEIKAWDIDVRPDFVGLPAGKGSVADGEVLWEAKCASCHGSFGESNSVFAPLVGGVTKKDLETGRSATLASDAPTRTALSMSPTVSTLWDYIHRAMPWNAPLSLSVDDTYAAVAYLLNLSDIVPADFVLDQNSIRDVQNRMPNRNGMVEFPGLWNRKGKSDVIATACMKDCTKTAAVKSELPDFARNAHGNLALQSREWGPVRGANTDVPAGTAATAPLKVAAKAESANAATRKLAEGKGCLACHGLASKVVGPGLAEVAAKYKGDTGAAKKLVAKVKAGGAGAWGEIPMPPQTGLSDPDTAALVQWILNGAPAE
jgi:cytochrome c